MMTYMIMLFIVGFLCLLLAAGVKLMDSCNHFFDKTNTNALRGFWCLIVVLVHIPAAYQNKIQDMIGSFAYIGVTFFFMTSSYGLSLSVANNPATLKDFWIKRLPKLLIPCLIINCVTAFFNYMKGNEISIWSFIWINDWVQWLLICYLIFWATHKYSGKYQNAAICIFVILFSLIVYVCKHWIERTTWCTEVFGFVWGVMLFKFKDSFVRWMQSKWFAKCLILCMIAGLLGISYLKLKPVVFYGDYLLKILLGISITVFMLAVNTHLSIGNRVSNFLGSISYEVYMLHGTVFGLVNFIMPSIESGLFILFSIIITVALSKLIQIFSKRLLNLMGIT